MSTYLSLARLSIAAVAIAATASANANPTIQCTPDPTFCTYFGEIVSAGRTVSEDEDPFAARKSFLSNLHGVGNEDFNGYTAFTAASLNISFTGSSGDLTGLINGNGEVVPTSNPYDATIDKGRFNTSGAASGPTDGKWWEANEIFNITFDPLSYVSAFGFYGTDIGDFKGQITVTLTDKDNNDSTFTINNSMDTASGSLLFWGFIDTGNSYKKIAFGNTNQTGTDYFGFDDMVVGDLGQINRVPEPATLALAGLGLIGLAATRRKQRH